MCVREIEIDYLDKILGFGNEVAGVEGKQSLLCCDGMLLPWVSSARVKGEGSLVAETAAAADFVILYWRNARVRSATFPAAPQVPHASLTV